jgi:hypothetical protein
MAPRKTTGKGKPPITQAEKAASFGLSVSEYQNERVPISNEIRANVNKIVKRLQSEKPDPANFARAWNEARDAAVKKYGADKLRKLKINISKSSSSGVKRPRKTRKSKAGKKGKAK